MRFIKNCESTLKRKGKKGAGRKTIIFQLSQMWQLLHKSFYLMLTKPCREQLIFYRWKNWGLETLITQDHTNSKWKRKGLIFFFCYLRQKPLEFAFTFLMPSRKSGSQRALKCLASEWDCSVCLKSPCYLYCDLLDFSRIVSISYGLQFSSTFWEVKVLDFWGSPVSSESDFNLLLSIYLEQAF